jgi:hypothetical protein
LQALFGGFFLAAAQHLDLRDGQVLGDGQVREQLEVLEHHAHARAQLRQVGLRVGDGGAVDDDVAFWNGSSALTHLIRVDLPEPDGPQTTITSPFLTSVLQSVSTWKSPYHLLMFLMEIIRQTFFADA